MTGMSKVDRKDICVMSKGFLRGDHVLMHGFVDVTR